MGLCGNCTPWQNLETQKYQADPDIAGIGIISTYIASASIALCLSVAHLVLTMSDSSKTNSLDRLVHEAVTLVIPFHIPNGKRHLWVPVIEKLVLNLSDQQLLTGLAVLIAGFWTHCSISVYHFALVNDLAWFSANVHLITLDVLQDYLHDRPMVRNWRVALMVAVAFLLIASTVMEGHYAWYDSFPYDAQCLFDNLMGNIGGTPKYWMLINLVLICIDYPVSIVALFERPTKFFGLWLLKKPLMARDHAVKRLKERTSHTMSPSSFKRNVKWSGCTILVLSIRGTGAAYFALMALLGSRTCALMVDFFWFAYSLWGILEDRNIASTAMDGDENAMTFGQIMPILLLGSLVLVFREAYDDQVKEMKNEGPDYTLSDSSRLGLIRIRNSLTVPDLTVSQPLETIVATQETEIATDEPGSRPPRRVDTEMGGGSLEQTSQTAELEGGQLQRRTTFPMRTDYARLGSG